MTGDTWGSGGCSEGAHWTSDDSERCFFVPISTPPQTFNLHEPFLPLKECLIGLFPVVTKTEKRLFSNVKKENPQTSDILMFAVKATTKTRDDVAFFLPSQRFVFDLKPRNFWSFIIIRR